MMDTSTATSPLLTVEQAAEALNVSVRFVRRLVSERRVTVHRLGRSVRFTQRDLDDYLAKVRAEAVPDSAYRRRPA